MNSHFYQPDTIYTFEHKCKKSLKKRPRINFHKFNLFTLFIIKALKWSLKPQNFPLFD
jgi:hypothetical protein